MQDLYIHFGAIEFTSGINFVIYFHIQGQVLEFIAKETDVFSY